VQDYWRAEQTNEYDEHYVCLITDNHQIKIGEHTFWDWED
jgi:hypothetical protein